MTQKTPQRLSASDRRQLHTIVTAIEQLKGRDVAVLDVRAFLIPTSFIVIASADHAKQLRALCEEVEGCLPTPPLRSEGRASQQWAVVDFGSVMVHIMSREAREFYELDALWEGTPVELGRPAPPLGAAQPPPAPDGHP